MVSLESFKQGMYVIFSPPELKKVSLPLISISSKVSKQSEIKEGQTTSTDFKSLLGISAKRLSVNGVSQPGPNLD